MTEIINKIYFSIDKTKIKKKLMIHNSQDEEFFKEMLVQAENIAHPRAMYRDITINKKGRDYIMIDDIKFKSEILRKNLDSANKVIVYIITVGNEIAAWANEKEDILKSYWADEIQKEILNSASNNLYQKMDSILTTSSENVSVMNPGSLPDWPIEEQKNIFSLLGDVENKIGVKLTASCLMLPSKSVSGIKFTTDNKFENCELCQRGNCPNRRVAFSREKFEEMKLS